MSITFHRLSQASVQSLNMYAEIYTYVSGNNTEKIRSCQQIIKYRGVSHIQCGYALVCYKKNSFSPPSRANAPLRNGRSIAAPRDPREGGGLLRRREVRSRGMFAFMDVCLCVSPAGVHPRRQTSTSTGTARSISGSKCNYKCTHDQLQ